MMSLPVSGPMVHPGGCGLPHGPFCSGEGVDVGCHFLSLVPWSILEGDVVCPRGRGVVHPMVCPGGVCNVRFTK